MDKIEITFPKEENNSFTFKGFLISVVPFIDHKKEFELIKEYIDNLNKHDHFAEGYIVAEKTLMSRIVDGFTNIKIDEGFDIDLIERYVWKEIKNNIWNYETFRFHLSEVISFIQNDQHSFSGIEQLLNEAMNEFGSLSKNINDSVNILRDKLFSLIDKFKDLDPEEIKNALNSFNNSLGDLNNRVPGLLDDEKTEIKRKPGRPKKSE